MLIACVGIVAVVVVVVVIAIVIVVMLVIAASAANMRIRIWWTGEIVFLVKCYARLLCECFQTL